MGTLLCLAGTVPLLAALIQLGPSTNDVVTEYFDQGHVARLDRLIAINGYTPCERGWCLSPGAEGSLVYRVPRQDGAEIGVHVWVYAEPGVTNSIIATAPGGSPLTLLTDVSGEDLTVPLPRALSAAPSVDIEIRATNTSPAQVLVIDQLATFAASGSPVRSPPALTYAAFGALCALVAYSWLRRRRLGWARALAVGVVLSAATATRCLDLFATTGLPAPDAVAYRMYADRFQWWPFADFGFFSGNFLEREPMFPMALHVFFALFGSSDFHERVLSVVLSIVVVALSMVAAQRRLLLWPAVMLVGLLLALSGPLIEESIRGLRLELEMSLLVLLYIALDRGPAKRPLLDALGLGAIGAAMVLTRTYYLPVFVIAVLLSFLARYRPSWRTIGLIGIAVSIMAAGETAHRIGLCIHHGDAMYDTAGYDRWNANIERYGLGRPLPHPELFPTQEQYQQRGPYFGPKISTYQYLFVIHSPAEFARDSLAGAREVLDTIDGAYVFAQHVPRFAAFRGSPSHIATSLAVRLDLATRWLVLLGLIALVLRSVRNPRMALIPVMVFGWLGLTAFLFDHGLLERYRHTWQTMPLALIAGVWLLQAAVLIAARHVTRAKVANRAAALARDLTRIRPAQRVLLPLLTLLPLTLVLALRGGATTALLMVLVMSAVTFAATEPAIRRALMWLLAASGPLAGAAFLIEPAAPAAFAVAPFGAVAAASLYFQGHRVALPLTLFDAVLTILVDPLFSWLGAAAAVTVLALEFRKAWTLRRRAAVSAVASAALVAIAFGASLAATSPTAAAAWTVRLSDTGTALVQRITVDRAGDTSVWFYGSRASALPGYSAAVDIDGAPLTSDLMADLPDVAPGWVRIPLPHPPAPGARIEVRVRATGSPDSVNRYIEMGGVYASTPGLESAYGDSSGLTPVNGTYLIVLGDDALPLAPGGLPEPLVRGPWQPPLGAWMPGERGAPDAARDQASTVQLWTDSARLAAGRPLGLGTGRLASSLSALGNGSGPGLTARDEFLQAAAEWGLAGLAGLLLALGAAAWCAWRARCRLGIALMVLTVVTMAGESLLADPAGAVATWVALGLCFAACPAIARASGGGTRPRTSRPAASRAG